MSLLFFLTGLVLLVVVIKADNVVVEMSKEWSAGIGGVIDMSSRVGKEQKIAMEMATSSNLDLGWNLQDSHGNPGRTIFAVMKLMEEEKIQAIISTLTWEEASLVYDLDPVQNKKIPVIVSITPTTKSFPVVPPPKSLVPFISMSNDFKASIQCLAAIVGHFKWRKVTTIYEQSNSFSSDLGLITRISDSLRVVGSSIGYHLAFPPVHSLSNATSCIEQELLKLKRKNNRVFVLVKSSLRFCILLFEKAKDMGMMEKGYVWIVSDDIANLLDSVDPSVLSNMQGVLGFKSQFTDTSSRFREFKSQFRRRYREKYPQEDEYPNPSIYALKVYDAIQATAKAIQNSQGVNSSTTLLENIWASDFEGLSGRICFKNKKLLDPPRFKIVNVIGKSYREIAVWSPELGFSEKTSVHGETNDLGSIDWPGGLQKVPKGWMLGHEGKRLKIGVPEKGACNRFVKVSYNEELNETDFTGFSIDVFKAALKKLPYHLPYDFVPYNRSYDEMIAEVNKTFDAVVGDTTIVAQRYEIAAFSQPYMEGGLAMVVMVKRGTMKERFMFLKTFTTKMWIVMAVMSISTSFVIWLNEHVEGNPEFKFSSISQHISNMLWFSITVLSFTHRESIKSNLSRFVLATWFFVIVIVAACFTATLTSTMTLHGLQPSVLDIEYLRRTNAVVGCNKLAFISKYLVDVLKFKEENIKKMDSIKDYPEAFRRGEILAAFLITPHAKVFLAQNCHGYSISGPTFKLGGLGFVFPKGSPLVDDISEAILNVTQDGEIEELEKRMLSFSNCTLSEDKSRLDIQPFSGLFIILGSISAMAFTIPIARLLERHWMILRRVHSTVRSSRRTGKWVFFSLKRIYTQRGCCCFKKNQPQSASNPSIDTQQQHSAQIEMEVVQNRTTS